MSFSSPSGKQFDRSNSFFFFLLDVTQPRCRGIAVPPSLSAGLHGDNSGQNVLCLDTPTGVLARFDRSHVCKSENARHGHRTMLGGGGRKHVLFAACSPARGESYVTEGERGGKNAALKKKLPLSC